LRRGCQGGFYTALGEGVTSVCQFIVSPCSFLSPSLADDTQSVPAQDFRNLAAGEAFCQQALGQARELGCVEQVRRRFFSSQVLDFVLFIFSALHPGFVAMVWIVEGWVGGMIDCCPFSAGKCAEVIVKTVVFFDQNNNVLDIRLRGHIFFLLSAGV
jgi:hypothetical protein